MNCNYLTKTNTASLYRNGNLITRASDNFTIRCCSGVDLEVGYACCCNHNRVCAFVRNIGDCILENVLVRFTINKQSMCGCNQNNSCCTRQVYINCIGVNCSQSACINLLRNSHYRYQIKVEVILNGNVLKEDNLLV